ncbi:MAG: N-Acetyl-D-glucosamine ABC transport system, permease protein 1, partial [uncultured Thermomicrobiales bacterium]
GHGTPDLGAADPARRLALAAAPPHHPAPVAPAGLPDGRADRDPVPRLHGLPDRLRPLHLVSRLERHRQRLRRELHRRRQLHPARSGPDLVDGGPQHGALRGDQAGRRATAGAGRRAHPELGAPGVDPLPHDRLPAGDHQHRGGLAGLHVLLLAARRRLQRPALQPPRGDRRADRLPRRARLRLLDRDRGGRLARPRDQHGLLPGRAPDRAPRPLRRGDGRRRRLVGEVPLDHRPGDPPDHGRDRHPLPGRLAQGLRLLRGHDGRRPGLQHHDDGALHVSLHLVRRRRPLRRGDDPRGRLRLDDRDRAGPDHLRRGPDPAGDQPVAGGAV